MPHQRTRAGLTGLTATLLLSVSAIALPAQAGVVTDPANDFIPTFTGVHNGSLDVLSLAASFDGVNFHISATENGNIASFPTGLFVIGFDRGKGAVTSNFARIGLPGVIFDSVITLTSTGVLGGRDLVSNTPIVLPNSDATIAGSTFQITIPLSALPSQGFLPAQYGVNLWPRDAAAPRPATATTTDFQIADFAPNAGLLVVPEPVSFSLLATGLLGLGFVKRRRSA